MSLPEMERGLRRLGVYAELDFEELGREVGMSDGDELDPYRYKICRATTSSPILDCFLTLCPNNDLAHNAQVCQLLHLAFSRHLSEWVMAGRVHGGTPVPEADY